MKKLLAFLLGIMVMAAAVEIRKMIKNLLHKNSLTLLPAVPPVPTSR